ncbi:MAG TPA: type II secretion system major pseudopilin GspG [Fimbriimonadaceae bacterium]
MKSNVNRRRVAKGFTLIEIMVVVLIIAIMAALVVPKILHQQVQAKITAAKSDLATMGAALQQFHLDCDRFPTTDEGLQALITPPSDVSNKFKGPYIEVLHKDPWQNDYHYTYPGQNGPDTFDLFSYGPTNQPGGEGDNAALYYGD